MNRSLRLFYLLLLVGLVWAMPMQAQAQDPEPNCYYWIVASPNSGYFDTAANWVDGYGSPTLGNVPGAEDDRAIIKSDGVLNVDATHPILASDLVGADLWVGDGTLPDQWPYGPLDPSEGHVVQNGGSVEYASWLVVGTNFAPGTSTWEMEGGSITQNGTGGALLVGDGAVGTMTVSNASIVVAGDLRVGMDEGAVGTLSMSGTTTATFDGRLDVGHGGNGSVVLSGSASLELVDPVRLGYNGDAALSIHDNAYLFSNEWVCIGYADGTTSTITMTGGSISTRRGFAVGNCWTGEGSGELWMSGNSLISVTEGALELAYGGNGIVHLGSGNPADNARITMVNKTLLGWGSASANTYARLDLNVGGTLETPGIVTEFGESNPLSSIFNFNGGTLKATANSADFFTNDGGSLVFETNVQASGAKIDTNGFSITINTPLTEDAASPGGGLTKLGAGTLTLGGANTYTGDTTVEAGTLSTTSDAMLADSASLWIAAGAVMDLDFTGADTIGGLYLDDVAQAEGTWGATGSGATNINNTYFTGTGMVSVGTPVLIPGDANRDGDVDEDDLATVADNWGTGTSWAQGDFDDDDIVGPKDAAILAANWGYGTAGESTAVPEPGTLVLLFGAMISLLSARRR